MKSILVPVLAIISLINFSCGSSSVTKENKINSEQQKNINVKPQLYYSGIYIDNPGDEMSIHYVNTKDSTNKTIFKLYPYYRISAGNFKLSPNCGSVAFYYYDSLNNKTNVHVIDLQNLNIKWLKSDRGEEGVDLVWSNDSLLYCNIKTGSSTPRPLEKYTSLINANTTRLVKNFTPPEGNELLKCINDKDLLYRYYRGGNEPKNYYYLIDKERNKLIRRFEIEDDSRGLEHFEMSSDGKNFFHVPYENFTDEKGQKKKNEKLIIQNVRNSKEEVITQTQSGFPQIDWSPNGGVVSFLKVGSINYNEVTRKYTNMNYLYLYDANTRHLTNLKTYEIDGPDGDSAGFSIPKTLPDFATIFNYLNYKWSPSGRYLFINRQDLTQYKSENKCILYDFVTKKEENIIDDQSSDISVEGWWEDNLLLLSDGNNYIIFDASNHTHVSLPIEGRFLYLEEER